MKRIPFTLFLIFMFSLAALAQESGCPKIKKSFSMETPSVGIFEVETDKEIERNIKDYIWKVKDGKVLKGQGTRKAEILGFEKYNKVDSKVTLEIKDLPKHCEILLFTKVYLKIVRSKPISFRYPVLFSIEGGLEEKDLHKIFDEFFSKLKEDNEAVGIIKLSNNRSVFSIMFYWETLFDNKNYDKTRILYAFPPSRKNSQTELWIAPRKSKLPSCEKCSFYKFRNDALHPVKN